MALRLAILLVVISASLSTAHAGNCSNAATQRELNDCANAAHRESDAELNALYRQIMVRLKGAAQQAELLTTAQKAWIAFRDAECSFAAFPSRGGSAHPMISSNCLDRLTRTRVDELKSYLHCEEGDLDCPLPPK